MRKHFLLTVSENYGAMFGVKFFSSFFAGRDDVDCTLFYVIPKERPEDENGENALQRAWQYLVEKGFPEENITVRSQMEHMNTASDIIREGVKGKYDAVILGRRGISRLEELISESLSMNLLTARMGVPIWACHLPDVERRDVLLCIDGSEASMRAADHVGAILKDMPGHRVTVMHVQGPEELTLHEGESIVDQAVALLVDNGVAESRLRCDIRRGASAAKEILQEAEDGRYAAVAVGRTGVDKPVLERLFAGSVSQDLLRGIKGAALWVSH